MNDGQTERAAAQRKLLPLPQGREKRLVAIERSITRARAALDVAAVALSDLRLIDARDEDIRSGSP